MHCKMSEGRMALVVGWAEADGPELAESLEAAGLIERDQPRTMGSYWLTDSEAEQLEGHPDSFDRSASLLWRTTVGGNALAKARIGRPMGRSKADALVAGVLERAAARNADTSQPYLVERIDAFGSYAAGAARVGDVDLRLVYSGREGFDERAYNDALVDEARLRGRSISGLMAEMFHAELEFQRFVRGRSARLDIQFDRRGAERPLPEGAVTVPVFAPSMTI